MQAIQQRLRMFRTTPLPFGVSLTLFRSGGLVTCWTCGIRICTKTDLMRRENVETTTKSCVGQQAELETGKLYEVMERETHNTFA